MATYLELDEQNSNAEILAKIRVGLRIAAFDIATRTVQFWDDQQNVLFPSVQERIWARAVSHKADNEAQKALTLMLASVADHPDLNALLANVTDAQVQQKVNNVVKYLYKSQSDRT